MKFVQTLKKGILLKRYKRFLADIETENTKKLTIYCPNTGSMLSCSETLGCVWYSISSNKSRKYKYTWELYQKDSSGMVIVNTHNANCLVFEALHKKKITQIANFDNLYKEVKLNKKSRIDFMISSGDKKAYIEVKSVSFCVDKMGYFPDSISLRAQKHLKELILLKKSGHRAILFFCSMHEDIEKISPAKYIDVEYYKLCIDALNAGVEFMAYKTSIKTNEVNISKQIEVII